MTNPSPPPGPRRGGRYGFSRDSRETTLTNGRRRIQDVASRLRLGSLFVDSAHRFFQIAVEKNFVQGRKTTHVVAACLYIACRQSKSQHMLIDFSDALQVNVYTLGTCFLKFRRLLGLKLEIIDPALYVYRFASHLELGEKANAVALTALRVTARMKRDWIVAGRRPAGVCAAALLIASRAHGFAKTQNDVTKILRVCGVTVNNRIKEFEYLPSARLTFEQFTTIDLDTEADPPSFTQNRTSELRNKAIANKDANLLQSEEAKDKLEGKMRITGKTKIRRENTALMYNGLERELTGVTGQQLSKEGKALIIEDGEADEDATLTKGDKAQNASDRTLAVLQPNVQVQGEGGERVEVAHRGASLSEKSMAIARSANVKPYDPLKDQRPGTESGSFYKSEETFKIDEWTSTIPEGDDIYEDMDSYLETDETRKQKDAWFQAENKDFLKKAEEKRSKIEKDKTLAEQKRQDAQAQEEKAIEYEKKREEKNPGLAAKKKKAQEKQERMLPQSDPDNIQANVINTIKERKVSRKIDYEAMSKIWTAGGKGFAIGNGGDDNDDDKGKKGAKKGGKKKYEDDASSDDDTSDSGDDDSSDSDSDSSSSDESEVVQNVKGRAKGGVKPTAKKKTGVGVKVSTTSKGGSKGKKSNVSVASSKASRESGKSKNSKSKKKEEKKIVEKPPPVSAGYDSESTDNSDDDDGGDFAFV